MATIYNPSIPGNSREVPDADLDKWTVEGTWLTEPPASDANTPKAARKPAEKKTPTARAGVPVVVEEPTQVDPERTPA